MKKQQSLHSFWAATDKPVIDMLTKKTSQSPSTFIENDSNDDNSDLESQNSSCASFLAVPKEFRPPLQIRTKIEHPKLLNQNKQAVSNQSLITASKNIKEKSLPKTPLIETPKPGSEEDKKCFNENGTSNIRENVNPSKQAKSLQRCQPDANTTTNAENNANMGTYFNKNPLHQPSKKMANTPLRKHNMVFKRRTKYENKNNEIKYEYVERQEQKTVKMNFEMPANLLYKNGLKIDVKMEDLKQPKNKQIARKNTNKNQNNRIKQDFSKDSHTVLYQENNVKWVNCLNRDEEKNDIGDKTERDSNKVSQKILYRESIVKWDSSLNLKDLSTDTECKRQDLEKVAYKTFNCETAIKSVNSLSGEDSSSDNQGRIEWTVIQEKKTILSGKQIDRKNHSQKQNLPNKPCKQNEQKKPRKRYYNNNYKNKNSVKPSDTGYQRNVPKLPSSCKDTDKLLVHKNDLSHISNTKQDSSKIHYTDPQRSSSDTENFTRQCRISENSQNAIPSLLNNYANINEREKSNSYPEKKDNVTLKNIEDQKKSMLHYGREMSDFIIGSHRALTVFISMFKEWKVSRLELIKQFDNLERNMKESSKKFTRYKDMLNIAKTGVSVAAAVPLPHVSIAARVISLLTGLFSVFLNATERKNAEIEDANDISIAAFRDTNASTEMYMYGLQCGQQFEETTKLIEEFHLNIRDPVIFQNDSPEIATFIQGVLEYRPRHRIFYKKLHKCFQELLHNSRSEFGKRFCEPFLLYSPEAVDVIGFLDWRFHHEDFNGESVRFELQQIEHLLEGNDTSIKELAVRIQKCVGILQDELKFLEGRVRDISFFEKSEHFGIKTFQY